MQVTCQMGLSSGSTNNNHYTAGSEDLPGADGSKARLSWLAHGREWSMNCTAFAPAVQIDPILPATITYVLTYPDGRTVMAQGQGDRFGSFVGKDKWISIFREVYHFTLKRSGKVTKAICPDCLKDGGDSMYRNGPAAGAPKLKLSLLSKVSFSPSGTLTIQGYHHRRHHQLCPP